MFAPMFKGIVHAPGPDGAALVTGRNEMGSKLSNEEYLRLVEQSNGRFPELVQDIARAQAAAILARNTEWHGGRARLVSVEGCRHVVGGETMSGARLMGRIWENVVPSEIVGGLPPPELVSLSLCTVEEIRAILNRRRDNTELVVPITHDYHADRVQRILKEEDPRVYASLMTPDDALRQVDAFPETKTFLQRLIRAAEPSAEFRRKEERAERFVNGPLHAVSHWIEQRTKRPARVGWNLESWLARKLRIRADDSDA